jgi:hypothetical protein
MLIDVQLNPVDDEDDYRYVTGHINEGSSEAHCLLSSTSSRTYTTASASASASPEIPWHRSELSYHSSREVEHRSSTVSPASSIYNHIPPICTRSPTPESDKESTWRKYMTGTCQKAVCRYPVKKGDAMVECGYKGRTHATKRHIETIHFDIKSVHLDRFRYAHCADA